MDEYAPYWKSIAHAFGHRDHIRFDTLVVLKSKKLSTATIATLYFVQYEQSLCLFTGLLQCCQKLTGRKVDPSNALDAFHDHTSIFFGHDGCHTGFDIIELTKSDFKCFVDFRLDLRVIGHIASSGGASVETFFKGEYLFASILKRSEFNGIFIGFSTTVDQKQLILIASTHLTELGRKFFLK